MSAVELIILAMLATTGPEKADFCERPGALCPAVIHEQEKEGVDMTEKAASDSRRIAATDRAYGFVAQ